MNFLRFRFLVQILSAWCWTISKYLLLVSCLFVLTMPPAWASLTDDRFEGNVFVLYGGNASLVPPRVTLARSLERDKATLLIFYLDDSRDAKQYAPVVTRLQAYYGRAADFIPVNVDTLLPESNYTPTEPGYYYEGFVPQIVVFNQAGKVVLNQKGQVPFEQVDDTLREVYDLLPRSESVELKRRPINEFNAELAE